MVEQDANQETVFCSFPNYLEGVDKIYDSIKNEVLNGDNPYDGVYGIPRGGLILAVHLSNRCGKDILPLLLKPTSKTLVVDDISDSGDTLRGMKCKRIATLFMREGTKVTPDIYAFTLNNNDWIKFWWEE